MHIPGRGECSHIFELHTEVRGSMSLCEHYMFIPGRSRSFQVFRACRHPGGEREYEADSKSLAVDSFVVPWILQVRAVFSAGSVPAFDL